MMPNITNIWNVFESILTMLKPFAGLSQPLVQQQLERAFTIPSNLHDKFTKPLSSSQKEKADAARRQISDGLADYSLLIISLGNLDPDDDYEPKSKSDKSKNAKSA